MYVSSSRHCPSLIGMEGKVIQPASASSTGGHSSNCSSFLRPELSACVMDG